KHCGVVAKARHPRINGIGGVAHPARIVLPLPLLDKAQAILLKSADRERIMVNINRRFDLWQIVRAPRIISARQIVLQVIHSVRTEPSFGRTLLLAVVVGGWGSEIINESAVVEVVVRGFDELIGWAPGVEGKRIRR